MQVSSTLILVFAVSVVVGLSTFFLVPHRAPAPPPLTYEVPIHVVTQTNDAVTLYTKRCNNTSKPLTVSVTAMWENAGHTQFVPLQPASAGAVDLPPGCIERTGDPISISYLPNGIWRLRGSVCANDSCGGFYTDFITVSR